MADTERQQARELQYAAPTVKVFYSGQPLDYQPLLCGIEEEGIPWELAASAASGAVDVAYEACSQSRLGVGVGITAQEIALHFEKLPPGQPLYLLPGEASAMQLRTLGANAARLVKKLPLKPL